MKNSLAICLVFLQFVFNLSVMADTYEQIAPISAKLDICENKEDPLEYLLNKNKRTKGYAVTWWGIEIPDARPGLLRLLNEMFSIGFSSGKSQLANMDILKNFPGIEKCKHEICIAREIFGQERGVYFLYLLDKYNFNLSPYSTYIASEDLYQDQNFFSLEEVKTISTVFNMLPPNLFNHFKFGSHFKKIARSKAPGRENVIADAAMRFYTIYSHLYEYEQAGTIIHELGHNIADALGLEDLDENSQWLDLSNWQKNEDGYSNDFTTNNFVSSYAKTSPGEDFAEAFSAYILNPNFLKSKSKSKYNYLKKNIFGEIEYDKKICQTKGIKKIPLKNKESNEDIKSCMTEFVLGIKTASDTEFNKCLIKTHAESESVVLSLGEEDLDQVFSLNFIAEKREEVLLDFVNIIFSKPEYCTQGYPTIAFDFNAITLNGYDARLYLFAKADSLCRWAKNGIKDKKDLRLNLKEILRSRVFKN